MLIRFCYWLHDLLEDYLDMRADRLDTTEQEYHKRFLLKQVAKYDARHDVLHLFVGEMEPAWDNEVEPGVFMREAMGDAHIVGATILGYAKHLEQAKKHLPFVDWQTVDKVVRDTVAQETLLEKPSPSSDTLPSSPTSSTCIKDEQAVHQANEGANEKTNMCSLIGPLRLVGWTADSWLVESPWSKDLARIPKGHDSDEIKAITQAIYRGEATVTWIANRLVFQTGPTAPTMKE